MRLITLLLLLTSSLFGKNISLQEMKRELYFAERELHKAHLKVLALRETIARKEIAEIQIELEEMEGSVEERLDFLDLRRKNISSIMREVPACMDEAQAVLDEILIAITDLKENAHV